MVHPRIPHFIATLRQRKVAQWTAAYLAIAWVVAQVLALLAAQFGWSGAAQRTTTVLLAGGAFCVAVIAWYHAERGRQRVGAIELALLALIVAGTTGGVARVRKDTPAEAAGRLREPAPLRAPVRPSAAQASILVLPLASIGGGETLQYLGDGITEELIAALGRMPGVRVASPAVAFRMRESAVGASAAGEQVGVQSVVEGTVRRAGERLRVTARLIRTDDGAQLWSNSYDRAFSSAAGLDDEIAQELAQALHVQLVRAPARQPVATNDAAYDAYLRGRYHLRRDGFNSDSAVLMFREAVRLDPLFASAHAGLARAYTARHFALGAAVSEYREAAFIAIEKALALDPDLADAYVARGNLAWRIENGFAHEAAARDFHRALELNPDLSAAHEQLASIYHHVGLNDRALGAFRTALELDPHSAFATYRIGRVLMYLGRYEEALAHMDRQADADRNWHRPLALWYLGRAADARAALAPMLTRTTGREDPLSVRAVLDAGSGNRTAAEEAIAQAIAAGEGTSHFHHAAYNIASAYALMGRTDEAMQWLRRAAREGFPNYELFATDPNLNRLRRTSAFRVFLAEQKKLWEYHAGVL